MILAAAIILAWLAGMALALGLCRMSAQGDRTEVYVTDAADDETWVWADGTIYDPAIPGYRQATADEVSRNCPIESRP